MKIQKNVRAFAALAASAVMLLASALPASAMVSTAVNATASTSLGSLEITARASADAKIGARITALTDLETRIGQMQKVTDAEKASLTANIQASISDMTALKAKIDADTDKATLKADIQSITKGYRIYLLILPQGRIAAASDRVVTITSLMSDLSAKLQARISAAPSGTDVTTLNAGLADMNAKIADANTQAQAAISEVATLQPDNGVASVYASNQAALKDARSKIQTAISDLKTARQDAGSIVKTIESWKVSASASGTTTTNLGH